MENPPPGRCAPETFEVYWFPGSWRHSKSRQQEQFLHHGSGVEFDHLPTLGRGCPDKHLKGEEMLKFRFIGGVLMMVAGAVLMLFAGEDIPLPVAIGLLVVGRA
jgi:hypothetical protein